MKKTISILSILCIISIMMISFSKDNKVFLLSNDSDAQAYIDSVGDIPTYFQNAIDSLVIGQKANGTWDSLRVELIFPPTQDKFKVLFDLKTLKQTAVFEDHAIASPYFTDNNLGGNDGILFTTNTGTGYIKSGTIPSVKMKLNNSAIAFISTKDKNTGNANDIFGAYQGTTQDIRGNTKNSLNSSFFDMYSTTNGRITHTSADGAKGVYIINRTSSIKMKVMKNGSVDSISTGQGTLPTIEMYFNCYNSSGVPQGRLNKPISAICIYGQSLTDAQMVQENYLWQRFIINTQRYGSYKKSVVFDGNSHTVAWWSKMFRQLQYNHSGINDSTDYYNVGTSGITTTTMITRASTVTDVLYNNTYSKNILIYWECTNDILAGKTAQQTYNNAVTYCQARQAIGWKVIIIPPMCRYFSGTLTKILCTDSVVTLLKTNWNTFANEYCDYPSANYFIPRSSYGSDALYKTAVHNLTSVSTYYLSDNTHLTDYAYGTDWSPKIQLEIDSL